MKNRVYSYSKITELKNADFFTEIAALPQITMSGEMAANMVYDMRIFKGNVSSFAGFAARLFPDWNTGGQRFAYVAVLNQLLREKISNSSRKEEKDWLYGCKKNVYMAITNIIRFEESNIKPEDLIGNDRDIILFKEMWMSLIKYDTSILEFRKRKENLKDISLFESEINKIFKFHGRKQIVWHGFQFFTPLQQYVFDLFKNSGYEVVALIQNDNRYPYANEIWNDLYTEENGFFNKNEWICQKCTEHNPIGHIFEVGEKTVAPNIRIIKYKNTIEFVEDVPRLKEDGYFLYCADDKSANNILRDYYPERYEVRNLMAYPIGQFIYTLHKMWDENLQCISLSQNGLRKCFASGWLSAKGKSSLNYTDDLEKILPYFSGCYTVDEWRQRLGTFMDVYDNVMDVFTEGITGSGLEKQRKEVMGNPIKRFGVFSVDENRIGDVFTIISQLMNMASTLFGENEPISISEHMSKLDSMLYMNDGMPQELYLEEREKVKEIFKVLESDKVKDFFCYPGDLAAALVSFMNGKDEDENSNNKGLKTLVFNLFQVQAAPISTKGKVHICLADINRLPGSTKGFGWPLTEEIVNEINARVTDSYLGNWIDSQKKVALMNRYYFYTAVQNENVEISWIEKQAEKSLAPSPYITLLEKFADIEIEESSNRNLNLEKVSQIERDRNLNTFFDLKDNYNLHYYDNELEYALCPMRYVYSYVLGNNKSYRNEFQEERAINRLIQILHKLLGSKYSVSQVATQIFELFPYLRKAQKRQILDDVTRFPISEDDNRFSKYEDHEYTDYRLDLTFLDNRSLRAAKIMASRLMSQEGRKGIFHERNGFENSRNCEFCPHINYCNKSLFGVDYAEVDK